MKRRLILTVALCTVCSSAGAQWMTTTEEDVFTGRNTAVMIGSGGPNGSVYFDCDAERNMNFAVIFPYAPEKVAGVPATIVSKVDDNERSTFDAMSYEHNDKYYGFANRKTDLVKELATEIRGARKPILFGLEVASVDVKSSFSISSIGSTKAAERFLDTCAAE